jgi:hypothetical protein
LLHPVRGLRPLFTHYVERHKYWAMGPRGDLDAPEDTTVINRTVQAD